MSYQYFSNMSIQQKDRMCSGDKGEKTIRAFRAILGTSIHSWAILNHSHPFPAFRAILYPFRAILKALSSIPNHSNAFAAIFSHSQSIPHHSQPFPIHSEPFAAIPSHSNAREWVFPPRVEIIDGTGRTSQTGPNRPVDRYEWFFVFLTPYRLISSFISHASVRSVTVTL
jgi:hypothetical protein